MTIHICLQLQHAALVSPTFRIYPIRCRVTAPHGRQPNDTQSVFVRKASSQAH